MFFVAASMGCLSMCFLTTMQMSYCLLARVSSQNLVRFNLWRGSARCMVRSRGGTHHTAAVRPYSSCTRVFYSRHPSSNHMNT